MKTTIAMWSLLLFACTNPPQLSPPTLDPPSGSTVISTTSPPPPVAGAWVTVSCPDAEASLCIGGGCLPKPTRQVHIDTVWHRFGAQCVSPDGTEFASDEVVADYHVVFE